jgi:hypothetical protein
MNLPLPDVEHRLRLPIVGTASKEQLIDANKNALETFIDECCFEIPGAILALDDFMTGFLSSLPSGEASYWNRSSVLGSLPPQFPTGKFKGNKKFIGNLSLTDTVESTGKLVNSHGYLKLEG